MKPSPTLKPSGAVKSPATDAAYGYLAYHQDGGIRDLLDHARDLEARAHRRNRVMLVILMLLLALVILCSGCVSQSQKQRDWNLTALKQQ